MPSLNILKKLKDSIHKDSSRDSSAERATSVSGTTTPTDNEHANNPKYRDRQSIDADRHRKEQEKRVKRAESVKRHNDAAKKQEEFIEKGPAELTALFRPLSMNQSKTRKFGQRVDFKDLDVQSKHHPNYALLHVSY